MRYTDTIALDPMAKVRLLRYTRKNVYNLMRLFSHSCHHIFQ